MIHLTRPFCSLLAGVTCLICIGWPGSVQAQAVAATSSSFLPDAPDSASADPVNTPDDRSPARTHVTGPYDTTISRTEIAPRLTAHDKILMGVRSSVTPIAAIGWVVAAGYEQASDGTPNYGQTGKGFVQRIGASAARASSEDIFSTSVLAPILHEDPRYYQLGPGHHFIGRAGYAVTRVFITRTDGGATTPNFSLLGGNLAGAALTQAYYPSVNRGFDETLKTFGGSVGGSALGYVVREFVPSTAAFIRLGHRN